MSGVPETKERRTSERLGKRPRRDDDIYLEVGVRGQLMRKSDQGLRNTKQRQSSSQETAEESDGYVQDQIIIAPEIMEKILIHLDLRALKQVRLVCKSWLLEAQPHIEKKGIVSLSRNATTIFPRLRNFTDMRENRIQALPQPFKSLDVNISLTRWMPNLPPKWTFMQLSSLCPPLEIRRLFTAGVPLKFVLPLLTQCSSSLEYLHLSANHSGVQKLIPWMEQDLNFPKLRHLFVHASSGVVSFSGDWFGFPATVARIMKASPNLDTFSTSCVRDEPGSQQLANEIILGVDITNVKSLQLKELHFSNIATQHMLSIPFSQLQNLEISLTAWHIPAWANMALTGIARTAYSTLRKLDLMNVHHMNLPQVLGAEFPVCPTVHELHMILLMGWRNFVSHCFPALQIFKTSTIWLLNVSDEDEIYRGVSPFRNVKTLILVDHLIWNLGPLELFSTFPELELLSINEGFFYKYFPMQTRVNQNCVDLLKGLKHLELHGSHPNNLCPSPLLAHLKGLESISLMRSNKTIARLPVKELPLLKVIRFNWGECQAMKKLLEIARGVARVVVTNCCSYPRLPGTRKSKARLEEYFAAAPNVECGCKKATDMLYEHELYFF